MFKKITVKQKCRKYKIPTVQEKEIKFNFQYDFCLQNNDYTPNLKVYMFFFLAAETEKRSHILYTVDIKGKNVIQKPCIYNINGFAYDQKVNF